MEVTKALPSIVMTLLMEPFSFHLHSYPGYVCFLEQFQFMLSFSNNIYTDCFHSNMAQFDQQIKSTSTQSYSFILFLEMSSGMSFRILISFEIFFYSKHENFFLTCMVLDLFAWSTSFFKIKLALC